MFDNTNWTNAEVASETPQFVELPSGNYDVVIDSFRLRDPFTTKNGYQMPPFLVMDFTVLNEGQFYGMSSSKEDGFWNETAAGMVKRDVIKLGCVIPKNYKDLPIALQGAIGKTINITVKTKPRNDGKGNFVNIYINKVVDLIVPQNLKHTPPRNDISPDNAQKLANITKPDNPFIDPISNEEIPF